MKVKELRLSQTSWLREEGDPQLGCVWIWAQSTMSRGRLHWSDPDPATPLVPLTPPVVTPLPSHPLTLPCPSGPVGGGAGSPVAVAPGIFSSEVSVMLPVCVCVSMPVCVCVCVGENVLPTLGASGASVQKPRITGPKSDSSAWHIGRERKREGAIKRSTSWISALGASVWRRITLSCPLLSVGGGKGAAGSFELSDVRIHQISAQKHADLLKRPETTHMSA